VSRLGLHVFSLHAEIWYFPLWALWWMDVCQWVRSLVVYFEHAVTLFSVFYWFVGRCSWNFCEDGSILYSRASPAHRPSTSGSRTAGSWNSWDFDLNSCDCKCTCFLSHRLRMSVSSHTRYPLYQVSASIGCVRLASLA
jgi:hypothetical protein